jgi:hypothetical protein
MIAIRRVCAPAMAERFRTEQAGEDILRILLNEAYVSQM